MGQLYLGDEAYDTGITFDRCFVVRAQHQGISWFMLGRFCFFWDVILSFEISPLDVK